MNRFLRAFVPRTFWEWVAVMVTVSTVTLGGYWSIIDRNPSELAESYVLTPVVKPGGEFSIRYKVNWRSTCRVTGYRFIIDSAGQQYTVAPDSRWISPDDKPEFTISIPIPLAAKPGLATYRAVIMYECNPLQKWFPLERFAADRQFEIVPVDGLGPAVLCPASSPVRVGAYCRRRPVALISD